MTATYILNAQGFLTNTNPNPIDFDTAYGRALSAFDYRPPSAKDLINLTEYLRSNLSAPEATPVLTAAQYALVSADVLEELVQGHKIAAIKIVRQATGAGLKESKEAVEQAELVAKADQTRAARSTPEPMPDWERELLGGQVVEVPEPVDPPSVNGISVGSRIKVTGGYNQGKSGVVEHNDYRGAEEDGLVDDDGDLRVRLDGADYHTYINVSDLRVVIFGAPVQPVSALLDQPYEIKDGDRVIFTQNGIGQTGRVFSKGAKGTVYCQFGRLHGSAWGGVRESAANITPEGSEWTTTIDLADVVAYEPLTEMPKAGDKLVTLGELPTWFDGEVGDIVTVRSIEGVYIRVEGTGGALHAVGIDIFNSTTPSSDNPSRRFGKVLG